MAAPELSGLSIDLRVGVPRTWFLMMRSMLAECPYRPVTMTEGADSTRCEMVTSLILPLKVSLKYSTSGLNVSL